MHSYVFIRCITHTFPEAIYLGAGDCIVRDVGELEGRHTAVGVDGDGRDAEHAHGGNRQGDFVEPAPRM
jgi:hypothetical protein